jgi:hypothetical protein
MLLHLFILCSLLWTVVVLIIFLLGVVLYVRSRLFITYRWIYNRRSKRNTTLGHLSLARDLRGVGVSQYLVFCVVFCWSMFVLLSSCSLSLYCLSVNLRFLITLLVSSNQSSLIVFFLYSVLQILSFRWMHNIFTFHLRLWLPLLVSSS